MQLWQQRALADKTSFEAQPVQVYAQLPKLRTIGLSITPMQKHNNSNNSCGNRNSHCNSTSTSTSIVIVVTVQALAIVIQIVVIKPALDIETETVITTLLLYRSCGIQFGLINRHNIAGESEKLKPQSVGKEIIFESSGRKMIRTTTAVESRMLNRSVPCYCSWLATAPSIGARAPTSTTIVFSP